MNLQYISDSKGQTTGVFIPIQEWEDLKSRYKGLGDEEVILPDWHINLVKERLDDYEKDSGKAIDFDSALDDLEKDF